MSTTLVTLGHLVDRVLDKMQVPSEEPRTIVLVDNINAAATSVLFNANGARINPTDIVEIRHELLSINTEDGEAPVVHTVTRGFAGTAAASHTAGTVCRVNPQWSRQRVAREVQAAFTYMEGQGVPLIATATLPAEEDPIDGHTMILNLPAEARNVRNVRFGMQEVPNWAHLDELDTDVYPTGQIIRLPLHRMHRIISDDQEFQVAYGVPYRWSTPPVGEPEVAEIRIPEGAAEVPVAYAAWQLTAARERSRMQFDRSEEWPQGAAARETGPALVRLAREEFYAALDAARRLNMPLRRRRFVKHPSYGGLGHSSWPVERGI